MSSWTSFHLFAGMGGDALGFQRAGFDIVGAIDADEGACRDFEMLTGIEPTRADVTEMLPRDVRDACGGTCPDVVVTSPPCKGNSSCLPAERAEEEHYQQLNSLSQLGLWLTLEAWSDRPPPIILLENVERITTRSREWLDDCIAMLREYGYATEETTHDCGELGGLAQHRDRYMLIARHTDQVSEFIYEPPTKRVKGVGEALGPLPVPVPGDASGGQMHRLPRLSALNWLRLALIPPGGDWRDLPEEVGVCEGYRGRYGVLQENQASPVVRANHEPRLAPASWADPRVDCDRREGSMGVTDWHEPSACLIAHPSIHNWPMTTSDPRLAYEPRADSYGVAPWGRAAKTVRAVQKHTNGESTVADPRSIDLTHVLVELDDAPALFGPELDLDSYQSAEPVPVISARDGTWHRPMTTLELAVLQGFPARPDGEWLQLDGSRRSDWRERIGNAIPPPAAEAIAETCATTLQAAEDDEFLMRAEPVWVDRPDRRPS